MGIRRQAREAVLKLLYAADMTHLSAHQARDTSWPMTLAPQEAMDFADTLLTAVLAHSREIDDLIQSCSMHWSLERIGVVERNILRFAICELLYLPDVPSKVTINEAVEIAKKYGAEDASVFVNGILDRIKNDMSVEDDIAVAPISSPN